MKELVKGFVWWLLRVLFVLNIILWLAVYQLYCQEHRTLHKDRLQQEDESGWMFINITARNDDLVYFKREGKHEVKIQSMGWDKDSVIQDTTKRPFEGCYLALYCREHLYIYVIQRQACIDNPGIVLFRPK